jgi:hypothetical protein
MWYGPVNQDGTMRKHRPATLDDKWGRPNQVQDMSADPCPGSHNPYARFGCDPAPTPDTQESAPMTTPTVHYEGASFHPVDFCDVAEGDTVLFLTTDNGYGGSGDLVKRTGTVRRKADNSVLVDCAPNRFGDTARLTRHAWKQRDVHRQSN